MWDDRPPIPPRRVGAASGKLQRRKRQVEAPPSWAHRSEKDGADAAVITSPASIAWLFNVRGGDVARTPLPLGEAILRADGTADLFLADAKVSPELRQWLGNEVAVKGSR